MSVIPFVSFVLSFFLIDVRKCFDPRNRCTWLREQALEPRGRLFSRRGWSREELCSRFFANTLCECAPGDLYSLWLFLAAYSLTPGQSSISQTPCTIYLSTWASPHNGFCLQTNLAISVKTGLTHIQCTGVNARAPLWRHSVLLPYKTGEVNCGWMAVCSLPQNSAWQRSAMSVDPPRCMDIVWRAVSLVKQCGVMCVSKQSPATETFIPKMS